MVLKRQPPTEEPEGFVERLAHTLGVEANATHIFAPPIERNGVTVIPVASARYGFGGGGGQTRGEAGSGGGGGAVIKPAGYIEITEGHTRYRPIHTPAAWLPMMLASGVLSFLVARGVMKLLRQ
jgi:uncharacterized spore protein YtfJ